MCRLAYIPANCTLKPKKLVELFSFLDSRQGGDGMGLGWIASDCGKVEKSVKADVGALAKRAGRLVRAGHGVIFHARKASAGTICDRLCHPFTVDGPAWAGVLAHNGHDSGFATLGRWLEAKSSRPHSDSSAHAYALGLFGWAGIGPKVGNLGGVILSLGVDGSAQARKSDYGDLAYCPQYGIWASELPPWLVGYEVGAGTHELAAIPAKQPAEKDFQSDWASYYNREVKGGARCVVNLARR